ncbi:MAG TPA: flagellar basal body P-ring formation chaperone FlgA [Thiobacillaceae bacterium]|nr:flagellar basal body P-ring formation chaperone FlgA [Thiobacillaceae bacterium]
MIKRLRRGLLGVALLGMGMSAAGAEHPQALDLLRDGADNFLRDQAGQAYPGMEAQVALGTLDPRLRLRHCPEPDFFLTTGSQPHGSGSLGIRCREPGQWTLYLSYRIVLSGEVLVAKRPLHASQSLLPADLELRRIKLEQPPGAYFRHPDQLRGTAAARPIAAGQAISLDVLKRRFAVLPNQRVRIVARGRGFQISQEGTAQNAAYMGDTVRVKMPSGRIIQGVADADGVVRVP